MSIILFSTTTCPKCRVLKEKLQQKQVRFLEYRDPEMLAEMKIFEVPVLSINGKQLNFGEAVKWINNYQEE